MNHFTRPDPFHPELQYYHIVATPGNFINLHNFVEFSGVARDSRPLLQLRRIVGFLILASPPPLVKTRLPPRTVGWLLHWLGSSTLPTIPPPRKINPPECVAFIVNLLDNMLAQLNKNKCGLPVKTG